MDGLNAAVGDKHGQPVGSDLDRVLDQQIANERLEYIFTGGATIARSGTQATACLQQQSMHVGFRHGTGLQRHCGIKCAVFQYSVF